MPSDGITKADMVIEIAGCLGVESPKMSTGSTEPREILLLVNDVLGLGLDRRLSKPELARAIVESAGFAWSPGFESRGSTVTREGLAAVLRAVELFVGHRGKGN
jgi:hypothetical protein